MFFRQPVPDIRGWWSWTSREISSQDRGALVQLFAPWLGHDWWRALFFSHSCFVIVISLPENDVQFRGRMYHVVSSSWVRTRDVSKKFYSRTNHVFRIVMKGWLFGWSGFTALHCLEWNTIWSCDLFGSCYSNASRELCTNDSAPPSPNEYFISCYFFAQE